MPFIIISDKLGLISEQSWKRWIRLMNYWTKHQSLEDSNLLTSSPIPLAKPPVPVPFRFLVITPMDHHALN